MTRKREMVWRKEFTQYELVAEESGLTLKAIKRGWDAINGVEGWTLAYRDIETGALIYERWS